MIVVDASLATKWLLTEADSEAALAFLEAREPEIAAPDLLAIEVCRALVTAANMGRIDKRAGRTLIAEWLKTVDQGNFRLYALDTGLVGRGADIALDLGHPLADCLYLALAINLGVDLVTCDARFVAKARVHHPNIRLLADFS